MLFLVRRWPRTCSYADCGSLAKSDGGSAFACSAGNARVGNPGDPLIGFPVAFLPKPETDNQELIADNWFMNPE